MIETTTDSAGQSNGPWSAEPPAASLLHGAAQGAHATIDRLTDGAAPIVREIDGRIAEVQQALHTKSVDAWAQSLRSTVRTSPLLSLAAALALGTLVARLAR